VLVEIGDEAIEDFVGLLASGSAGEAKFADQPILRGAQEALDASLGLRRVRGDLLDAEFVEGAADLGGKLPAGEFFGDRPVRIVALAGLPISTRQDSPQVRYLKTLWPRSSPTRRVAVRWHRLLVPGASEGCSVVDMLLCSWRSPKRQPRSVLASSKRVANGNVFPPFQAARSFCLLAIYESLILRMRTGLATISNGERSN
jgi:hypothetical protein